MSDNETDEKYTFEIQGKDLKKLDLMVGFMNRIQSKDGELVTREDVISGYIQTSFEQFTEELPWFNVFVQKKMGL